MHSDYVHVQKKRVFDFLLSKRYKLEHCRKTENAGSREFFITKLRLTQTGGL